MIDFKWAYITMIVVVSVMCICVTYKATYQPECTVEMNLTADMNIANYNEVMNKFEVNSIKVTAPCGSKLYELFDTARWGN